MADAKRVVLVTGASSGIGKATAEHLARRGWRVFAGARRPEALSGAAGIEPVRLDVTDDASAAGAVEDVLARAGRIDGLVNNAGGSILGALEETSPEQARALLETNLIGVLRLSQAVLPAMRRQGSGRIVNVSSVVGFLPAPYMGLYAATKHAVEGLSESMDHEVRGFGVRVAVVEPGFTRTNIGTAAARGERAIAAYATQRERVIANMEGQIARSPGPETVAIAIERALGARGFARLPVGFQAGLLIRLSKLMPAGLFDRAIRQNFSLDG